MVNYLFLECPLIRFAAVLFFLSAPLFLFSFEKQVYDLPPEPIDIVIPCCEKDTQILDACIAGAKANIANVRRIIVVSPERYSDEAEWYDETLFPFQKGDVADELGLDSKSSRIGWYFQQLLKFYAPITIPGISSNVLILDADTIFLKPVNFINQEGGGLYAHDTRIHHPYFDHMDRLIPGFERAFPKLSGICHHMLFQKDVIIHLLETIEKEHKTEAWRALCRVVDPAYRDFSGMAEYEIYFNFVFHTSDQMALRPLKFANISNLRQVPLFKRKGYHFVSCHHYMRRP